MIGSPCVVTCCNLGNRIAVLSQKNKTDGVEMKLSQKKIKIELQDKLKDLADYFILFLGFQAQGSGICMSDYVTISW